MTANVGDWLNPSEKFFPSLSEFTRTGISNSYQLDIVLAMLTPMVVVDMIVCLIGILVNTFIIKIALRDQSNLNAIQCLLVNLSLSYTACIILVLLHKLIIEIMINVQVEGLNPNIVVHMCKVVMIIQLAIYNTAMITLSIICIEQLRQITLTFSRKLTRSFTLSYVIPSAWFVGIVCALPLMKYVQPTVPEELFLCEIQYNGVIGSIIYVGFLVMMIYLLPTTLVVVCYGKIVYKMKQSDWGRWRSRLSSARWRFPSSQPQQGSALQQDRQYSQRSNLSQQKSHTQHLQLPICPSTQDKNQMNLLQVPLPQAQQIQPSQQASQQSSLQVQQLPQIKIMQHQESSPLDQLQNDSNIQIQQHLPQPTKLQRQHCRRYKSIPDDELTPRQKKRLANLQRRKIKMIRMLYILIALYLFLTTVWIVTTLISIFLVDHQLDDKYNQHYYLVPILLESGDFFFLTSCICIPLLNIIHNDKLRHALPTCRRSSRHWSISNNVITVRPDHL